MPRSSRSKSHRQSSRHTKELVKEHSEDCEVDIVNVYEPNSNDYVSAARVSDELARVEKRKFDMFGDSDGDFSGEVVVSRRRKERVEKSKEVKVEKSRGKEVEGEKLRGVEGEKSKEVEVEKSRGKEVKGEKLRGVEGEKSKGKEVKVEKLRGVEVGKLRGKEVEEIGEVERKRRGEVEERSEGRVELKRKCDKNGNDCRKDVEVVKKRLRSDGSGDREVRRGRGVAAKDDIRNYEVEKEIEKKVQKRVDYLGDKNKHQDDIYNAFDKRSLRGDCSKDTRHKDERRRDKYQEDDDKDIQQREDKLQKESDRSSRYKDAKYRDNSEKKYRHRDEKYSEDRFIDSRHRDDEYCKDSGIYTRHKEEKYPKHVDKYDNNDRHNGCQYGKDGKTIPQKEEKRYEHIERDNRHRDAKQKAETDRDREKRAQDVKFMDRYTLKDHDSESEMKHTRNESDTIDPNQRKSSNHDSSPTCDDRVTKYKSDMVKKRLTDREGYGDVRYKSINKQHSDVEKKSMNNDEVYIVTEKGSSNSRKTDVDTSLDYSYRRNSPNSSTRDASDHYRVSIPEEPNPREYGCEEKARHNRKSSREFLRAGRTESTSARPVEKYTQNDDSHFDELSHDRLDARASPLSMADKSLSSTNTERRHLNSSEIRKALDTEQSAMRRGSSRDYSGRKEAGGLDMQKEMHLVDELSQVDGESFSNLPPLKRNSNSTRSFVPPSPFRKGLDFSPFGYSEDDTRGRSNNHYRRNSNSKTGSRVNAWDGVPNWPSNVPSGFMPLQHVPPVNFLPAMQQLHTPQIFDLRPTMDFNNMLPFNMPVTKNFPVHGCPIGWQNPVDDSCPPVNGWDAHTHGYMRSDWDQNRGQTNKRGRDTNADLRSGKDNGLSGDLTSIPQKEDLGAANNVSAGQLNQQAQSELFHPYSQECSSDVHSPYPLGNIIAEAPMGATKESRDRSEIFADNNASSYHIYLSRLDISADLTQPDLYNQLTSLTNMDQIKTEEDKYMMIYMEEIFECDLANEIWTDVPFSNDSVFQNAMSLYKKQREDIGSMNKMLAFSSNMETPKVIQRQNNSKAPSGYNNLEKEVLASLNDAHTSSAVSDYEGVETSSVLLEAQASSLTALQRSDEPCVTNIVVVSKDQACMPNEKDMGVHPVFRQDPGDFTKENKSAMQLAELSKARGILEEMKKADELSASNSKDDKLIDTKGPMLYSDVSSEADLVEFEAVYISWIHRYYESTH
ncbi:hypothetical protein DCAR_0207314 [Daucus carota subsp. sativus]|uniref:Uncharacterized protein n=1 Tax=Daucus carota subsp. sativus TaxID=79200 RepID=A0AAF1APY4_DAUCS|nr:PREDICTED: biorientation of chromosomes in cell division protein 1-like 1 [Daucus carota subsp. sativus]WOG88081.1 hypothetical protein DCAR_0207314 [Daucus carota subsp. sativus]